MGTLKVNGTGYFAGPIWSLFTAGTEAQVGVNSNNINTYLYSNANSRGIYDTGAGSIIEINANGVFFKGTATWATNAGHADLLDGYHESDFFRSRGTASADGEGTLWDILGVKEYHEGYPDGMTHKIYSWGAVISLPGYSSRLDLYANHQSSGATTANGLQFRTGWGSDKQPWRVLLDSSNFIHYSLPLSGGTLTGDLIRKVTNVNASLANNNISSVVYPCFEYRDKDNRRIMRQEAIIQSNGNIGSYWYVQNYDTSGTSKGLKGIKMTMDKNGALTVDIAGNTTISGTFSANNSKLLWKNPSSTAVHSFAAQTVSVPGMSSCKCIVIIFNHTNGDSYNCIIHKDAPYSYPTTPFFTRMDINDGNWYTVRRSVTPNFSNSTIYFGSGYQNNAQRDDRAVPIAIIGLH